MNPIHNEKIQEKLHETGKKMADKTDHALTQVGGVLHRAAGQLEAGSQYLNDSRASDIQADLTTFIRKYPTQSLIAGLSLGILTGAVLGRR
jgi:ElaB/YqjD/DUF883 family membrane-anchored ribosome-binding protein